MSSDLSEKLHDLAPSPSTRLDFARTWTRGQRLRRRRLIRLGIVPCLLVGIPFALVLRTSEMRTDERPASPPTESGIQSSSASHLREIARALQADVDMMQAELDHLRVKRKASAARLRSHSDHSASQTREIELILEALDKEVADLRWKMSRALESLQRAESGQSEATD